MLNPQQILIKELIKNRVKTRADLSRLKRKIAKQFRAPMPTNVDLLKTYHILVKNKIIKKSEIAENILITRPIRSLSGIINVSVLTKPYPCPGSCIFCPTEKDFPKSYLSGEPAADRAATLNFNPYLQVRARLQMLKDQGHATDKIELRIIGGSWSAYTKQYQTWFVKKCFQAANEFHELRNLLEVRLQKKPEVGLRNTRFITLEKAQKQNEKAKNRIVGLSIETRPDFITKKEIKRLRKLGVTLVEMGVQAVFGDVLNKNKTGLTTKKIAQATKLLKNAGFKILYQVMPNLPGSSLKKDLKMFEILFNDQQFKPDWLKIYPCLVCKNTKLYKLWKAKKYKPYTKKQLINLLIKIKQKLPYYTRLTRVFRDIPAQKIIAGCKTSNIREVVQAQMRQAKLKCKCIRCREIRKKYDSKEKPYLFRQDYNASEGKEIFLSFENKKRTKLFSILRLRILESSGMIREIQTFGQQIPIIKTFRLTAQEPCMFAFGKPLIKSPTSSRSWTPKVSPQHKGLGKKLILEAEKITKKEFGLSKIAVISGIGAREYYRKHDYKLENTYMVKNL